MIAHADFAAVLGIGQEFLRNLLLLNYLNGRQESRSLSGGIPGFFEIEIDLFNDVPQVTLTGSRLDSIYILSRGWGLMSITGEGPTRQVELFISLSIPLKCEIDQATNELLVSQDVENLVVSSVDIAIRQGDPWSHRVVQLLESDFFRRTVETELRNAQDLEAGFEPIDLSALERFIGMVGLPRNQVEWLPVAQLVPEPNDMLGVGTLNIGIDVRSALPGTFGNPRLFEDINQGTDLSICVNAAIWLPLLREELLKGSDGVEGIETTVAANNATLDRFELTLGSGHFHIEIDAGNDLGSVQITLDVVPSVSEEGTLVTRNENVQVDVEQSAGVLVVQILGGIFSVGFFALWVEDQIEQVKASIISGISAQPATLLDSSALAFEGFTSRLRHFHLSREGFALGISLRPQLPRHHIFAIGLPHSHAGDRAFVYVSSLARGRVPQFAFGIQLPPSVHRDDPLLRIAWEARRIHDNAILATMDAVAASALRFQVHVPGMVSDLVIRCRVYRTLGDPPAEFYHGRLQVVMRDFIDRTHPYVRWEYPTHVPDVEVQPDGTRVVKGMKQKWRKSTLHRTDLHHSCHMLGRSVLANPAKRRQARIFYLDQLPFAAADLHRHRGRVCEYCFFGNPQSSNPIL